MSRTGSAYFWSQPQSSPICQDDTHLGQTGGEHDNLIDLAHLLQEVIHPGPLDHVDVMCLRFDLDGNNKVGRGQHLKAHELPKHLEQVELTLKLLCNRVSSRSSTKHFRPECTLSITGNSGAGCPCCPSSVIA